MNIQSPRSIRAWMLFAALAGISVYLGTLSHGFVFDDQILIVRNAHIRSIANLPEIFSSSEMAGGGRENQLYRPLTTTTYALNFGISGLAPWSYHLVNLLLHGLVSALVVLLGIAWGLPTVAAGVAGVLFAVHPVHVEAVAGVVGRKELLAGLFLVLLVLLHGRARRRGGVALLIAPLAYACAMLSKETGIVGIGLVALFDVIRPAAPESRPSRRKLLLYGTYVVLALFYLAVRRVAVGGVLAVEVPFFDNPAASASAGVRWMTGMAVIGKGLLLQVLPLHQSPDYSFDAIPLARSVTDWRFLATAAALVAWLAAGMRLRRDQPAVVLGAGWYLLTVLPASNLLFATGTIFGERLLYVPSAGLLIAAGALFARLVEISVLRRTAVIAAFASIAGVFSAATVLYAAGWRDELQLFTVAVEHVPASTKVHHKRGEALLAAGRTEEAVSEGRRALEVAPGNSWARVFLSDALRAAGRSVEAEREIQKVLASGPDADALYAAGRLRREAGFLDEAADYWTRAIEADPSHAASLADLGTFALVQGDTASALLYFQRATRSNPAQANAWYNLALIHESQGDVEAARKAYERFLESAGPEYSVATDRVRSKLQQQ